MRWQIEPMPAWPYPETQFRKVSPFSAGWHETLSLLDRELDALAVTGVVAVRVVGQPGDVRLDGMLRATARLAHPGVAISVDSAHGSLTYPCDTFVSGGRSGQADWQVNARAIALALEALRRVDRYGVGGRGEQYAGWRQIGAGTGSSSDADQARAFLAEVGGGHPGDSTLDLARAARIATHPDRHFGDHTHWDRVEQALATLGVTTR